MENRFQVQSATKTKFTWDDKEEEEQVETTTIRSSSIICIRALEIKEVKFPHKHQVRKQFIKQTLLINMVVDVT